MFPIRHKNNPTIDIYFRAPLRSFISEGLIANSRLPIRRIGPNCFLANNKVVVIRYVTETELKKIQHLKPERLFYVVDDDFHGLTEDNSLPSDYRKKLAEFASQMLPTLLKQTDTVVSPNLHILDSYQTSQTLFLGPSYTFVCDDFSHFDNPSIIKILFGGSRSHLADLETISNMLADLCRQNPQVELTTFLGKNAPDNLRGIKNIVHRAARPWSQHKKIMAAERFHIGLSPYNDTRFNRCRSVNKILDHAAFGVAGLYSDLPPVSKSIQHGKNGLLLVNSPSVWKQEILKLTCNIEQSRQMAQAGAGLAREIGHPKQTRRFWAKHLLGENHEFFKLIADF